MKKRPYTSLWFLLASAFAVVFTLSCFDNPPVILGHALRTSSMADIVTKPRPAVFIDTLPEPECPDTTIVRPAAIDSTAQTILLIGDSMLDGLAPRLAAYAEASGHTLYTVVWYSSSTESWGKRQLLKYYIKKLRPSFIFICLGSNELNIKNIFDKRLSCTKEIINEADTIPYLWIGPPNWKKDTGINDLISTVTAAGCYFRSADMTFDRRTDGAHPTAASAALWMDSIIQWMPEHHPHPIFFAQPHKSTSRPHRQFMHKPNEI